MNVFPHDADLSPVKRVKFGIDPTFSRLHLGHFVPLRLVKKLAAQGHDITIVLGTFTAQLGDPSGRDTTRPILPAQEVEKNAEAIKDQVRKLLGIEEKFPRGSIKFFRNGVLHNNTKLPEFFKFVSQFTLAHMTSRNAFQDRIENGQSIALHELLVPILQGLDSVALKTEIEIGGQDQLFNFQIARQLQENDGQKPQACILLPIINGTDGRKMSKSLGNCIFLDEDPADIFGKVMSISDAVMSEWLPLFTDWKPEADANPMFVKKQLAFDIVQQIAGLEAAITAKNHFEEVVQNKQLPDDIPSITATDLLDAVVKMRQCSKTAARNLIGSGGVRVNNQKVVDCTTHLNEGEIVQAGKRNFAKIGLAENHQ